MKKVVLLATCLCLLLTPIAWGAAIKDSESATHAKGSSQHKIIDTYTFPGFKVIQFKLPVLSV